MLKLIRFTAFILLCGFTCSCGPQPAGIPGCTHESALNFDPTAEEDDGSCDYYALHVLGDYVCEGVTEAWFPDYNYFVEWEKDFSIVHHAGNMVEFIGNGNPSWDENLAIVLEDEFDFVGLQVGETWTSVSEASYLNDSIFFQYSRTTQDDITYYTNAVAVKQ
jgi:hypothetical protein